MLHYIIWNAAPIMFQIGSVSVKWYGVCILLAFWGGRQITRYIYKAEHRPLEDVDHFSTCILTSALIGARIGEIFFYNPGYYLTHPIEAFLPMRFSPHFQITGYAGLSYHGAIIGSIIGTYYYVNYRTTFHLSPIRLKIRRVKRRKQSFLWLSTPLALSLMMGFWVRIGNFMNSEIILSLIHI